MTSLSEAFWRRLPLRRRRSWRYISPRRHGVGVTILALLVGLLYAYVYLTNDARIRRHAKRYLRQFSGGQVVLAGARFRLFGGIELTGVKAYVPGQTYPEPFFSASKVVLRHRPWSLFTRGRLQPTEIVCVEPTVFLVKDMDTNRWNLSALMDRLRSRGPSVRSDAAASLPRITVLRGALLVVQQEKRLRLPGEKITVGMSLVPVGPNSYRVQYEETLVPGRRLLGRHRMWGVAELRLAGPVSFRLVEGRSPIELVSVLPQYRKWRDRYKVTGEVQVVGSPQAGAKGGAYEFQLAGASLELPPEEGGVGLHNVSGILRFERDPATGGRDCVTLRNVTGRVPQAGQANLRMSGQYEGYGAGSPFDVEIWIEDIVLPGGNDIAGPLGDVLASIRQRYEATGKFDVWARLSRKPGGALACEGVARPEGMTVKYSRFPYRLDDMRGEIHFTEQGITRFGLRGSRQAATARIDGVLGRHEGRRTWDVTVLAENVPATEELRQALPRGAADVWDDLRPAGTAGAKVRVYRGPGDPHEQTEVTIRMDGAASFSYRPFPYRLEKVSGEAVVVGDTMTIQSVRGQRGDMWCSVNGTVSGIHAGRPEAQVTVIAHKLPLDEVLAGALGDDGAAAFGRFGLRGTANRVTAVVKKSPGKDADYVVEVKLREEDAATFRADLFPYDVTGVAGEVTIVPGRAVLNVLTGRHGPASVALTGQVLLEAGEAVPNRGTSRLELQPVLDVHVLAKNLPFDKPLYDALPEPVKASWDFVSPSGQAELVDLTILTRAPRRAGQADYRLVVNARDMGFVCRAFPYPLRHVSGQAIARPGRIDLAGLRARQGEGAEIRVDGHVDVADERIDADLTIQAEALPVDADLLKALPGDLAPLVARVRPGGSCNVCLKPLRVQATGATAATGPASRPRHPPAPATWQAEGSLAVASVTADLGFGRKVLTGRVAGKAARVREGVTVDAQAEVASVRVGKGMLTQLRGRVVKPSPSARQVRIDQMEARAHGGLVTGFAEVELSDPLKFGLRLAVENLRLSDLVAAGLGGARPEQMQGLLTGNLELRTAGADRQAAGTLRIGQGQLYELPVLLGLFHVIYLALPQKGAFSEGGLTYHLRGDTLILREVYLTGSALSVVGSGTMDLKTERLNLTFLGGPPKRRLRLSGLEGLLGTVAKEILEVRVTGTLSHPVRRTVPLRSLKGALERLLDPDADAK